MTAAREARPTGRRDPRAESIPPSRIPGVVIGGRPSMQRQPAPRMPSLPPRTTDLAAELAAEREARARDASTLGEMFIKVCDADAKRRMSELAADALVQRVATLESELRELRARGGKSESAVTQAGEARARRLQERLYEAESQARAADEKLRTAEARAREAESMASRLEQAALASKHDASGTNERIAALESELLSLRSGGDGARHEEELRLSRAEASARAAELEHQRARITELDRSLVAEKEEHARTALRLTVAETRAEELAAQIHDLEQRGFAAEWESQKAMADADAARRRADGLEAETSRLTTRAGELERELETQRRATEQAEQLVVARLGDLEGARASEVAARASADQAELARAAVESALRSIVTDLEEHDARATDFRRRTLTRARDVLAATPRAPTAPRVSLSGMKPVEPRAELVTPVSSPRGSQRGLARPPKK